MRGRRLAWFSGICALGAMLWGVISLACGWGGVASAYTCDAPCWLTYNGFSECWHTNEDPTCRDNCITNILYAPMCVKQQSGPNECPAFGDATAYIARQDYYETDCDPDFGEEPGWWPCPVTWAECQFFLEDFCENEGCLGRCFIWRIPCAGTYYGHDCRTGGCRCPEWNPPCP